MIRRNRNRPGESDAMRQMRELIARPSTFVARSTVLPDVPPDADVTLTLEQATAYRIAALRIERDR